MYITPKNRQRKGDKNNTERVAEMECDMKEESEGLMRETRTHEEGMVERVMEWVIEVIEV